MSDAQIAEKLDTMES